MKQNVKTILFDLDGTVYQNTTFHNDYLKFLVEGTKYESWEKPLVKFADDIFSGKKLSMNQFYKVDLISPSTPEELFLALEKRICPKMTYQKAIEKSNVMFLGDAWAVVTVIGKTLGLLENDRGEIIYRRTRGKMEQDGMKGNPRLKKAIVNLSQRHDIILMSNSYKDTVIEFLHQLDFDNIFQYICSSANKPFEIIENLNKIDPEILKAPENIIAIGDNAYNDLMPIQQKGGYTVWLNPFVNITRPVCDDELATLDDLAVFLDTL